MAVIDAKALNMCFIVILLHLITIVQRESLALSKASKEGVQMRKHIRYDEDLLNSHIYKK